MKAEQFEKDLGIKLMKLREAKRKTQANVAEEMGLGRSETVKQWENGQRHIKATDLVRLSRYYCVSVDYLLGLAKPKAVEPDLKYVCEYTGLTDEAVWLLHNIDTIPKALSYLSSSNHLAQSTLLVSNAILKLKEKADEANSIIKKERPSSSDLRSAEKELKIAIFDLLQECIAPALPALRTISDTLGKAYSSELMEYIYLREEANDGEHQED